MPRESKKARIARMHQEYEQLCVEIPDPKCALNFNSPFELLVATVLSAQTTDKRVNMVTPELFGEYPGPAELAAANPEHVEDIIRTIGFFRTKARNIIGLSHELCVRFGARCQPIWLRWSACRAWAAKPRTWCWATRSACPVFLWTRM